MYHTQTQSVSDPVCGMSVNPATAKFTAEHAGTARYFCSPGCRDQFIANPDSFVKSQPTKVVTIRPEILYGVIGLIAIALMTFALRPGPPSSAVSAGPKATVTGASAGQNQAVDDGSGGVIASASLNRSASTLDQLVIAVSLNTHAVNLTDFRPVDQVRLRIASGDELEPLAVSGEGELTSHHLNYRLTFPRPSSVDTSVIVKNVAGVAERKLPIQL
ncbi:MAG: YHS domain-containing protein [Candidatus Kerfeldbacteria bacterium]|nr:YHS domain-containing protein [Candidatus Kerfeldbacteria bacterium]